MVILSLFHISIVLRTRAVPMAEESTPVASRGQVAMVRIDRTSIFTRVGVRRMLNGRAAALVLVL